MDSHPSATLLRSYIERLEARDWDGLAELLHPEVVYRLPQSREVVRGRDAYLRWNREYPDGWHLRLVEAYGDETGGAARVEAVVDDDTGGAGGPATALVFVVIEGGAITEIRDWWPTPYEPPPGRGHLAARE